MRDAAGTTEEASASFALAEVLLLYFCQASCWHPIRRILLLPEDYRRIAPSLRSRHARRLAHVSWSSRGDASPVPARAQRPRSSSRLHLRQTALQDCRRVGSAKRSSGAQCAAHEGGSDASASRVPGATTGHRSRPSREFSWKRAQWARSGRTQCHPQEPWRRPLRSAGGAEVDA